MEEFKKRLLIEKFNLKEMIDRFNEFINSPKFTEMSAEYSGMCYKQLEDQCAYYDDLTNRIKLMVEPYYVSQYESCPEFDFGTAIRLLREGRLVSRKGWNGKSMFIVKQVPAHITGDIIPKMQSLPQACKDLLMAREDKQFIDYTNQMLIVDRNGVANSWLPSSSDVYATD